MKKLALLLISVLMSLSLTSCNEEKGDSHSTDLLEKASKMETPKTF